VIAKTKTTRTVPRIYEISDADMSPFERRGSVHRSPTDPNAATTREDDTPEICDVTSLERQSQSNSGSSESDDWK